MSVHDEAVDHAIRQLPFRNTFRDGDVDVRIAFLLRAADWRPLEAPWWRGKEAYIIGADYNGNFFLRHCDGSVRYWEHHVQADRVLASGVKQFLAKLAR